MTGKKTIFTAAFLALLALSGTARAAVVIRDQEIEAALKTLSVPIFEQAGVTPQVVRFVIVQDDDLNAFVAGGQNIFVNTGLILKTESASELAGVIAHETGHIALGHLFRSREMTDNMSFQSLLSSALGLAAGVATKSSGVGMAVARGGQSMALNSALGHSRSQESAADQAGVRFLNGARLPLAGFLSFMRKMSGQELLPQTQQSKYMRTHPLTQERIDFLEAQAENAKGAEPAPWAVLHARMKAKLLGYLFPDRALQDRGAGENAQYARAIAFYRKGQMDKALAAIDALLAAAPRDPYFHELKGQVLFEAGRAAESLAPYARAVEILPKAGLIRAAYGYALLEAGGPARMEQAIVQLTRALDTEPQMPSTHRFLAIAYGKTGREGLSRLHLAEQYVMQRKFGLAKREAGLAKAALEKTGKGKRAAGYLRAEDILAFIESVEKRKDGDDADDPEE